MAASQRPRAPRGSARAHGGEREVLARDFCDQRSARLAIERRRASRLVDGAVVPRTGKDTCCRRGHVITRYKVDRRVRRGCVGAPRQRRANLIDERFGVVGHPQDSPLLRQAHQRLLGDKIALPEVRDLGGPRAERRHEDHVFDVHIDGALNGIVSLRARTPGRIRRKE